MLNYLLTSMGLPPSAWVYESGTVTPTLAMVETWQWTPLVMLIVLGGMAIALRCRHQFGRLVGLGIATNFFLYVFVNVAMVMGAIPVGGVPLPLVSYGGSAMLTVMLGFGILMSVHVHRDAEFTDSRED